MRAAFASHPAMSAPAQADSRIIADSLVRVDALRSYMEVVRSLGGDPVVLLERERIEPDTLLRSDAFVSYRALVNLLEHTATALDCPDFGLRLATHQGGIAVLGPLAIVMRNCATVGEAYRYCADHLQVYSSAVRIQIEEDRIAGRHFMHFEIILPRIPQQRQAVENALALTHQAVRTLSQGRFGARELWFRHDRLAPLATYEQLLGIPVRFGMPFDAVVFKSSDLGEPISGQDAQLHDIAAEYIDARFPAEQLNFAIQVRLVAARLLSEGRCTLPEVAAHFHAHPRTLQRRLRDEGTSFDLIKDDVRRDAALRYVNDASMPLSRIAALLGYSEPSVLTRSFHRWFASSPRQLRNRLNSRPDSMVELHDASRV
jgi:AraC-like DNA-binding protein